MILSLVPLVVTAFAIYPSCGVFVNGVEWVGRKAGIAENGVGPVPAAFGTALRESVVTLVAVAFSGGSTAAKEIGVGAALGGPLILSTVAYAVVGAVMWLVRPSATSRSPVIHDRRLARHQGWFLIIFIFKVGLGFLCFAAKPPLRARVLLLH